MTDNKNITGEPDRARVAGGERYEVEYLARKHGMSPDEVREVIARLGNDRDAIERELAGPRRN